jgi:hypothetical protein
LAAAEGGHYRDLIMRNLKIATVCVLALFAAADARGSASARPEILAGYGETSPKPLRGEGGANGALRFSRCAFLLHDWR